MKRKKKNNLKRKTTSYSKLNLFQKPGIKFFRPCPLSRKDAPLVDYKNIKLLKKYISESGRILPSRITSVCSAVSGNIEYFKKIGDQIIAAPIINDGSLYVLTENSRILGFN